MLAQWGIESHRCILETLVSLSVSLLSAALIGRGAGRLHKRGRGPAFMS